MKLIIIFKIFSAPVAKAPEVIPGYLPKFTKLPTDSLVAEGEHTIFECQVTGEPRPEVKWFLDSKEITQDDRINVCVFIKLIY